MLKIVIPRQSFIIFINFYRLTLNILLLNTFKKCFQFPKILSPILRTGLNIIMPSPLNLPNSLRLQLNEKTQKV